MPIIPFFLYFFLKSLQDRISNLGIGLELLREAHLLAPISVYLLLFIGRLGL